MEPQAVRELRGRRVAYLAQSAAAAFNPALTIGEQVTESAVQHGTMTQAEANGRAEALYRALELPDPDRLAQRYPHPVSCGQLQRLMAAWPLRPTRFAGARRTDDGAGCHHAQKCSKP